MARRRALLDGDKVNSTTIAPTALQRTLPRRRSRSMAGQFASGARRTRMHVTLSGIASVWNALFWGRPSLSVEPFERYGILKLAVKNRNMRSIVIREARIRPPGHWYLAPNVKYRGNWYDKTASSAWKPIDLSIGPGETLEFFLGLNNSDTPAWCIALIRWQSSGGVPLPHLPLIFYRNKRQIERLFRSRKSDWTGTARR